MTRPEWCPADIWMTALELWALLYTSRETDVEEIARAILAERERAVGVANERVAQLWAAYELPGDDESKAGYAGQMIEALLIEQRLRDGHVPKQSIEIAGLHDIAKGVGFQ